jgi:hypothetical protein
MKKSFLLACVCATIALPTILPEVAAQAARPRAFSSPEEAAKTLVATVKKGDVDALMAIFGPDGKDLLQSSEPAAARQNRQVFSVAAAERWRLEDAGANRKTLVIGNEDWPFPVPIVKQADGWHFDAAAGKEEVVARRIGGNELAAIETVRAYVAAQHRYAADGHDGNKPGAYATKFRSDPGKQNGLYWPVKKGEKRSPLGDLVAQAAEEGRTASTDGTQPSPYHGYYFRILPSPKGFALVAWPAQYDVTGVMTFIVNEDGVVKEKNLGPNTDTVARSLRTYSADASWKAVQ